MCLCDIIEIALLFMKSIFINVKKGMSELGRWLAAKHTTCVIIEERQIACAVTEKKIDSMCYHGKNDRQHVL